MDYPKISVIIHCFNRENFIEETLDSVIKQNYPNVELIVIDDNSTDKSWDIIQRYKDKISYMEKLGGKRDAPVYALNVGFSHSTGEIMCWLNTKNILLHRSLFVVADIFSKIKQIKWLTGLGSMIDNNGNILRVRLFRKNIYDYANGKWETIQQESTFWRRELWEETGGTMDMKYPWSFDAVLWAKFFKKTELYHVNTTLGAYRQNAESTSILKKKEFFEITAGVIADFKKTLSGKLIFYSRLYKIFRLLKPLLGSIPDSTIAKIPLLKKYTYSCVSYHLINGVWEPKIYKKNSFNDRIQ
jgi:glycosyltransferase involved in cell wall biosynthesis